MKYATTSSLRTQQAVARYGKAARHPFCLAALDLWRIDAELSKWSKDLVSILEVLNIAKQMREKADTPAFFRKINRHLLRVQTCYEAIKKLRSFYQEGHRWAVARFEREHDAALCAGKKGVLRALGRLRKRWSVDQTGLNDGNARKLEMLSMLRERVIEAKREIDGVSAGLWEALRGSDRPLTDELWQERLTARQIHSRIAAVRGVRVAGDKDAKEIRRLARKLLIRLAQDKPGRRWKWPYPPRQEQKQPPGRPRTRPVISFVNDLEAIEASKAAAARGKIIRSAL